MYSPNSTANRLFIRQNQAALLRRKLRQRLERWRRIQSRLSPQYPGVVDGACHCLIDGPVGRGFAAEDACCPTAGIATQGSRQATHRTTAYLFFIAILRAVPVQSLVGGSSCWLLADCPAQIADDCANARACSAGNQRTLDPTAKHCTQHGPGGSPDQCTLTRTNTALVAVIVVVIRGSVPPP